MELKKTNPMEHVRTTLVMNSSSRTTRKETFFFFFKFWSGFSFSFSFSLFIVFCNNFVIRMKCMVLACGWEWKWIKEMISCLKFGIAVLNKQVITSSLVSFAIYLNSHYLVVLDKSLMHVRTWFLGFLGSTWAPNVFWVDEDVRSRLT